MPTQASTELELLQEISQKLSQLLTLTKLTNLKAIAEIKAEIAEDPVAQAAMSAADGSLSAAELKTKVAQQTRVSEKTVQRRISELVEKGILNPIRKGNEMYYLSSGLFD